MVYRKCSLVKQNINDRRLSKPTPNFRQVWGYRPIRGKKKVHPYLFAVNI